VWRRSVAASDDTWRIEMKCAFQGPTATRCCSCSIIVKRLTITSPVGHVGAACVKSQDDSEDARCIASSYCLRIVLLSGMTDVTVVKDGKEINLWILCRFDENVLLICSIMTLCFRC